MEIGHFSWPWHRNDATALAGYANMMMMIHVTIVTFSDVTVIRKGA